MGMVRSQPRHPSPSFTPIPTPALAPAPSLPSPLSPCQYPRHPSPVLTPFPALAIAPALSLPPSPSLRWYPCQPSPTPTPYLPWLTLWPHLCLHLHLHLHVNTQATAPLPPLHSLPWLSLQLLLCPTPPTISISVPMTPLFRPNPITALGFVPAPFLPPSPSSC